ncbi:maleylpyruvate isomerase N-terminal domain-containing protein [Streptomyces sp. NPDC096132]|uniref:maleylpyruvate isomerase N-terminal domain-containing protein n=1 Tax=Streptomyces sp. NPDC096132 TaxID=3366075 RepID=UPI0037F53FE9
MSDAGVTASRLLVADALRIARSLKPEEWQAQSAAEGWRVQDVFCHMAVFFNMVADPSMQLPENPSGKAERMNDLTVDERRHWTPAQVLDYYEAQSGAGLAALEALQGPGLANAPMRMAELGTYRMSELSDAMAFDHLVHLSADVLMPRGPVGGAGVPLDEERVAPALEWMLSGLPKMCGGALFPVLTEPVRIVLDGPGALEFVLARAETGTQQVAVRRDGGSARYTVRSSTTDFLLWGTTREPWQKSTEIDGGSKYVADVLSAINIV